MYEVKIETFEGPLDLLLHLVDRNKLDITEVSLALIVGEYEGYINRLRELNLEVESSFLTVFASLLEIKSKVLLPVPPKSEEEEPEPEHELITQLKEYRLFKESADKLEKLKEIADSSFRRPGREEQEDAEPVFTTQLSVLDLMDCYTAVLRKLKKRQDGPPTIELARDEISFPLILRMIGLKLRNKSRASLHELFDAPPNRLEFIVTFLALLEMARRRKIFLVQNDGETKITILTRKGAKEQAAEELAEENRMMAG